MCNHWYKSQNVVGKFHYEAVVSRWYLALLWPNIFGHSSARYHRLGENKKFIQVMWILLLAENKFIQVKVYDIFTAPSQSTHASNSTTLY
jgi:hypothetical protein